MLGTPRDGVACVWGGEVIVGRQMGGRELGTTHVLERSHKFIL